MKNLVSNNDYTPNKHLKSKAITLLFRCFYNFNTKSPIIYYDSKKNLTSVSLQNVWYLYPYSLLQKGLSLLRFPFQYFAKIR